MYEMLVRVHEVSWEMLGTMSKMILRRAMRTKWMAQAPAENVSGCNRRRAATERWLLTFGVDPFRVEVGQSGLVADVLQRLRGLGVHQTARPSPPCRLGVHAGSCSF